MNQILEGSHLLHVAVHEIDFVLAAFLSIVIGISYLKTKISRILFSKFGFGVLVFGQAGYMYSKILQTLPEENMFSGGEILDISILIMTIFFVIGVFYKKNR